MYPTLGLLDAFRHEIHGQVTQSALFFLIRLAYPPASVILAETDFDQGGTISQRESAGESEEGKLPIMW